MNRRNVAILVFDDVEVLDFAGPFEVFGVAGQRGASPPFDVYTVGPELVMARNGLAIAPHYRADACPSPNVLVVPGGYGTRRERHNRSTIDWIRVNADACDVVLSVCSGALLLAAAGLLAFQRATTHRGAFDLLGEAEPTAILERESRFCDNGKIVTSAGISAGIDASLHLVARLAGHEVARETAEYMEYGWTPATVAESPR